MNNIKNSIELLIKTQIKKQQWDYCQIVNFYFFINDSIIGSCELTLKEEKVTLNSLYLYEKYRGIKLSHYIIKEVLKYNDEYVKRDVELYVRNDNFIINTYKNFGFEFVEYNEEYQLLIKKYKKDENKS